MIEGTFGISKNQNGDYKGYAERTLPPKDSVINTITKVPVGLMSEAVKAYNDGNQARVNEILSHYL